MYRQSNNGAECIEAEKAACIADEDERAERRRAAWHRKSN